MDWRERHEQIERLYRHAKLAEGLAMSEAAGSELQEKMRSTAAEWRLEADQLSEAEGAAILRGDASLRDG